jgi:uncharacterized membrane protein
MVLTPIAQAQQEGVTRIIGAARVRALSSDGTVAAGDAYFNGAFRWVRTSPTAGTITELARPAGNSTVYGTSISPDGSVVFGYGEIGTFAPTYTPLRWDAPYGPYQFLDGPAACDDGSILAVASVGGTLIVGGLKLNAINVPATSTAPIHVIPPTGPTQNDCFSVNGSSNCAILQMSRDARVIVGEIVGAPSATGTFVWSGTFAPLPQQAWAVRGTNYMMYGGVSGDGRFVFGVTSDAKLARYPVLDTGIGPPQVFAPPPGYSRILNFSVANFDGSVCAGSFRNDDQGGASEPFIWIENRGFILPRYYPPLRALSGPNEFVVSIQAMSDDGHTLGCRLQVGVSTVGAVVILPRCGTADYNCDGDAGTDQDIAAFFACLAGHCSSTCYPGGSDFNRDGDHGTDQDIESFFRVLAGGTC